MGYYIDLEAISLDDYRARLASAYLPPSRAVLRERLEERMGFFKSMGIRNVAELMRLLRQKDNIARLSGVDCLSGEYLAILHRELKSMLPKPNKIAGFPGIPTDAAIRLEKAGMSTTVKLYDHVKSCADREQLARATGLSDSVILELTKLTDLSRIKWVGTTFARMLYDVGIDTLEKAAHADPVRLHALLNRWNREKRIFKGQIGLRDIEIVIQSAKEVPVEITY